MAGQDINEGLNYVTYGLYIVTSADGTRKNGMIVNTVFQVTAEPARVAISVNKNSLTHEIILKGRVFAAMPLEQNTPLPFIGIFGFRSGRTEVEQTVDVGTHTLFIGQVKEAGVLKPNGHALTYAYYHQVIKGKTPAGATHL